jgi:hypothetical protein
MEEIVRTNRPKRSVYRFRKTFSGIAEGIKELIEVKQVHDALFYGSKDENKELQEIITNGSEIEIATEIEKRLLAFVFNNPPTIADPTWPNTVAITVRGDNFSFRTKDDMLFAWNYSSDAVRAGKTDISINIKLVTPRNVFLQGEVEKSVKLLKDMGWEAFEVQRNNNNGGQKKEAVKEQAAEE